MHTTPPSTIAPRVADAVRDLANRPWTLFLLLLAFNALVRPYAGIAHDARLYSVQVLNQIEGGTYADDLFFRYGSQDSYSLFSRAIAPLADLIGVETTFFVLYLIFNSLFLLGVKLFVEKVVKDRVISTIALLYIFVSPGCFGGFNVFHVHEQFFTARLIANTFGLFALTCSLNRRWRLASVLLVLALAVHPLMGFACLLLVAGAWAIETLPRRVLLLTLIMLAGVALATLLPPLGNAIYKSMDAEWREGVRRASPYDFPTLWGVADWFNVGVSLTLAVMGAIWVRRDDPQTSRFLAVAAFMGAAGFLSTLFASMLPYAILFQGQPYRVLWILKLLQAPLAFLFVSRLWASQQQPQRVLALLILLYFGCTDLAGFELSFVLFFLPFAIFVVRVFAPEPIRTGWLWRSLLGSMILALGCITTLKLITIVSLRDELFRHIDLMRLIAVLLASVGSVIWVAAALFALVPLARKFGRRFAATMVVICVLIQCTYFATGQSKDYLERYHPDYRNFECLRTFLKQNCPGCRPTVYCSFGPIEWIWLDLQANSYFNRLQIVGAIFNRDTARESLRRAAYVKRFEFERVRDILHLLPDEEKLRCRLLFGDEFDSLPRPGLADLQIVCKDPAVDYVAVKERFEGLYSATNGEIYIYDCARIRALGATSLVATR